MPKTNNALQGLVPIRKAAKAAGIHYNTIRRWCREKRVPAVRTAANRLYLTPETVQSLMPSAPTVQP